MVRCRSAWTSRLLVALGSVLIATPVPAASTVPLLPTLPPLPTAASVTLGAGVIGIDSDGYQNGPFGVASATGMVQVTRLNPMTLQTETFTRGGTAAISASGGTRPAIRANGQALADGSVTANGHVGYFFSAIPLNTNVQAPGPIPVLVTASAGGGIQPGSEFATGSIINSVAVDGTLVAAFAMSVANGTATFSSDNFSGTTLVNVSPFAIAGVSLNVSSGVQGVTPLSSTSTFSAFADPEIIVDPDAVFEHGSEMLRYIDHYGIAYSEGVEQFQPALVPLPGGVLLLASALGFLRRRIRLERRP